MSEYRKCPNCKEEVPPGYDVCWSCSYNFISQKPDGFVSEKIDFESVDWITPKNINCLRCKTKMDYKKQLKLHEGANYGIIGDLGHLFTNRELFDVYRCQVCGKVELFTATVTKPFHSH